MPKPPAQPKIYHIVHVDRSAIGRCGRFPLVGRRGRSRCHPARRSAWAVIKQRGVWLPVDCHPGDHVGEYVPFYFCPRSIMLFVIHCANHPELAYRGGQAPIVHLEADLRGRRLGGRKGRRWAFCLSNAGAYYAEFRSRLDQLDEVNWAAVDATDFRAPTSRKASRRSFSCTLLPW